MKTKAAIALLFIILVLGALWGMMRDRRLTDSFTTINKQADETHIRAIMGAPSSIQRPCQAYDTGLSANCDHIFIYKSSFSPLRQKYWLVFFDENNRATATSTQVEP